LTKLIKFDGILCFDFEASSFNKSSYPVEIGTCDPVTLEVWSSLIRREPGWTDWSWEAETIHGISKRDLEAAPSASVVASEFARRAKERLVLSDAPQLDARWLLSLMRSVGERGPFWIADLWEAAGLIVRDNKGSKEHFDIAFNEAEDLKGVRHRAGPDAHRNAFLIAALMRRYRCGSALSVPETSIIRLSL
jgi:hypothetical protein